MHPDTHARGGPGLHQGAPVLRSSIAVSAILIAGLAATGVTAAMARRQLSLDQQLETEVEAARAASAIRRHVDSYLEVLFGLRSLFAAGEDVTRVEFAQYIAAADIDARYPGIQAMEFTRLVQAEGIAGFERSVQSDTTVVSAGYPSFTVHPDTVHGDRFVVDYVEPLAGNEAAFGFDLGTNPVRRRSVEESRDTGLPVATSGIRLVQERAEQTGFLLMLGVYGPGRPPTATSDRRAQFRGVVNVVCRMGDLVAGSLGPHHAVHIAVWDAGDLDEPFDPANVELLHDDDDRPPPTRATAGEGETLTHIGVGGRRWTIVVRPRDEAASFASTLLPWVLLVGGVLLTLAAAGLARSLLRGEARALELARVMTVDLELNAEALRAARDRAEAADRAKSVFLANTSHEMRTPLHGILGAQQLLLETPLDDTQREYAEITRSSASALRAVINDVLDLAKIDAGTLELVASPFELRRLLHEVVAEIRLHPSAAGLEITHAVTTDVPEWLTADAARLRQVLTNLMGNAVKFTHDGSVTVHADVCETEPEQPTLHLTISDTGIGIPAERHRDIFERFTQVDSSSTRSYGGTGLGLAVVTRLVELMGGAIRVESEAGRGSAFGVSIPAVIAAAPSLGLGNGNAEKVC